MRNHSLKFKNFEFSTLPLRFSFLFFTLLFLSACQKQSQNLTSDIDGDKALNALKNDLAHLPNDIIRGSKHTFLKSDNITALLLAGGASAAMHNDSIDDKTFEWTERHRLFHNISDRSLKSLGNPGFHFAASGLWYLMAENNNDVINKARAWTMIEALSITGLSTATLKAVRNNKNPNTKSWAWPSGHTSSSFAVASVLDEFYGPKVGIPAYVAASMVGYRMVDSGDHWASDAVFGATLGWIVGHSIAGNHKLPQIAGFQIIPYTQSNSGPTVGINLLKRF